jgi:hypothetical protein
VTKEYWTPTCDNCGKEMTGVKILKDYKGYAGGRCKPCFEYYCNHYPSERPLNSHEPTKEA